MRTLLEVALSGITAVMAHPQRSLATIVALVAVLTPFLCGLGITRGLRQSTRDSVVHGADLYVHGEILGRTSAIPRSWASDLKKIPGVERVIPRIVGRLEVGADRFGAVVIGLPPDHAPVDWDLVEGRLCSDGSKHEVVLGSELAQRLGARVGSVLPPLARSRQGDRTCEVVGIFRTDASPWQAWAIGTTLNTAGRLFDQPDLATDLLVYCQPGYEEPAREAILAWSRQASPESPRLHVISRSEMLAVLPQGVQRREGVFAALFVLGFAIAILIVTVTSGFGLAERRREAGLLRAIGWHIDQLLLRSAAECLMLCLVATSASILLAWAWMRLLNGWWIAGVFLNGVDQMPEFDIPFRMSMTNHLLTLMISLAVTFSGSLLSVWRAAVAPPASAMR